MPPMVKVKNEVMDVDQWCDDLEELTDTMLKGVSDLEKEEERAEKEKARASTLMHLRKLDDELVEGNFLETDLACDAVSEVAARIAGVLTSGSANLSPSAKACATSAAHKRP